MEIEILNWGLRATTRAETLAVEPTQLRRRVVVVSATREIICDIDGTKKSAAFIHRDTLSPGDQFNGPALVTEAQTTTLVSEDFSAHVDAVGNLVLIQQLKRSCA